MKGSCRLNESFKISPSNSDFILIFGRNDRFVLSFRVISEGKSEKSFNLQ